MLSSFEEASRVFDDRGIRIGINTVRQVAQRFASRAKIGQHLEALPYTESLDQRRVVVSTDGGRVRIRKDKRGPRTKKGRRNHYLAKILWWSAWDDFPTGYGLLFSETSILRRS